MLNQEDDRYVERILTLGSCKYQGSSVGGEKTYHGIQSLKVCLDLGAAALSTTNCNTIIFSHGHSDHCNGLIPHLWRRNVRKLPMANYYAQKDDALLLQDIVNTSSKLSRNNPIPNVVSSVTTLDKITLDGGYELSWFNSVHRVPCLGTLISQSRKKIKNEYKSFSKVDLQDLRRDGVELYNEVIFPEIAYTGDTSIEVFNLNPNLLNTRYLITECTGLDRHMDRDKVRKAGHIHLDDLVELFKEQSFNGEKLILGHFSARYSSDYIQKIVMSKLPELSDKIILI